MKKNGFIFMETIVVVSVLSITLLLLFTSYSFLLRKARERNVFDTTDTIYKAYNIMDSIRRTRDVSSYSTVTEALINSSCDDKEKFYECDFKSSTSGIFNSFYQTHGLEKIYLVQMKEDLYNQDTLLSFDATTIDYLLSFKESVVDSSEKENLPYIAIFKFKKCYEAGTPLDECKDYEVFHARLDLENEYEKK